MLQARATMFRSAPSARMRCAGTAGFSLLELLVALTILAIALIPVAYFYSKSLQQVEQQAIRTRALSLAMERMAEVRQLPANQIRKNTEMSAGQRYVLTAEGVVDMETEDWTGGDFEANGQARGMFFYPLPLTFNPYNPDSWYYDNTTGVDHFLPNDGLHGVSPGDPGFGSQINLNDGGNLFPQYEYEPVGFYKYRVLDRDASMDPSLDGRVDMSDRRLIGAANPPLAAGIDYFRTGTEDDADKYGIFGRRTIILEDVPATAAADTDGDNFGPNDDFDGGATALNPYPVEKGPDDKYTRVTSGGSGYEVTVQVFWLPRNAPEAVIPWKDLNKIELKGYIAEDGTFSWLENPGSALLRDYQMIITAPN